MLNQFPMSFIPTSSDTGRDVEAILHIAVAEKGRHAFGTHMVYRETFLQIHMHLHQLLILRN